MPVTQIHPRFLPDIAAEHLDDNIRKAIVHIDTQPPPAPQAGTIWLNPDTGEVVIYDASVVPVSYTSTEATSVNGITMRSSSGVLEYSTDGGSTWNQLAGGGGSLPPTEDVYYVLTEDYPRPDLAKLGFDPLMVADGASWEFVVSAPWARRYAHTSVVTPDGRIWVMGGYGGGYRNDVYYSFDGSTWTQATSAASWRARYFHTSVVTSDGRIWVMGGYGGGYRNDVYYSTDGSIWTQTTSGALWSARRSHSAVTTPDGRIWVMGGYNGSSPRYCNDVWYSFDGSTWTQATSAASWTGREHHTSVVTSDGRIWVMGGYSNGYRNDVYYSTDGSIWTQATSGALWSGRYAHTSVVTHDGRIWILGGGNSNGYHNDVYYSFDGSTWTQATSAASWTGREHHTSVVTSDGRIWVMGGWDGTNRYNDVYRTSLIPQTINAQTVDPAAAPQQLYMYRKVAYVSNGRD